jgi:hypothetical protein
LIPACGQEPRRSRSYANAFWDLSRKVMNIVDRALVCLINVGEQDEDRIKHLRMLNSVNEPADAEENKTFPTIFYPQPQEHTHSRSWAEAFQVCIPNPRKRSYSSLVLRHSSCSDRHRGTSFQTSYRSELRRHSPDHVCVCVRDVFTERRQQN